MFQNINAIQYDKFEQLKKHSNYSLTLNIYVKIKNYGLDFWEC